MVRTVNGHGKKSLEQAPGVPGKLPGGFREAPGGVLEDPEHADNLDGSWMPRVERSEMRCGARRCTSQCRAPSQSGILRLGSAPGKNPLKKESFFETAVDCFLSMNLEDFLCKLSKHFHFSILDEISDHLF
mgnify:CR=1 FL=1